MGLEEKQQTREIDGYSYTVTPLTFGIGQKALIRTIKVISPILSSAFKGGTVDAKDPRFLAGVIEAIPSSLSEEDFAWFTQEFGKATFFTNGTNNPIPLDKGVQELHFAGRYLACFQWLMFCLEVNFSGFFAGMQNSAGGAVLQAMAPLKTASAPL